MNCWKSKSKDMTISIQALDRGKVQRLSVMTEYASSEVEAQDILRDEDIVRSLEKFRAVKDRIHYYRLKRSLTND